MKEQVLTSQLAYEMQSCVIAVPNKVMMHDLRLAVSGTTAGLLLRDIKPELINLRDHILILDVKKRHETSSLMSLLTRIMDNPSVDDIRAAVEDDSISKMKRFGRDRLLFSRIIFQRLRP